MKICLTPYTRSEGIIYGKNAAAQAQIVKEYLKGVARMWPNAWGDNSNYMLTRAMGIEIIMGVFDAAKIRCDPNEGRQYLADRFRRQLNPLENQTVEMPSARRIALTWERGPSAMLSNKPGRLSIQRQLVNYLRTADDSDAQIEP